MSAWNAVGFPTRIRGSSSAQISGLRRPAE